MPLESSPVRRGGPSSDELEAELTEKIEKQPKTPILEPDRDAVIAALRMKIDEEKDWRKKAAYAARIISLRLD